MGKLVPKGNDFKRPLLFYRESSGRLFIIYPDGEVEGSAIDDGYYQVISLATIMTGFYKFAVWGRKPCWNSRRAKSGKEAYQRMRKWETRYNNRENKALFLGVL